ncbi:MAG: uncharacterized protein KVP18_002953 [Porospora cf. gigantea A]|uniref:uncharacterized protein n=1 Tax=Porospora cf. gigantea A TaxID=2853593 RepID=UPI003559F939|nr:MAG: hypothetical protein KVP18_002953 [Porospora cf. gigantea A]
MQTQIKKTQQNRVNKQIGDLMNDTGISDDTSKDEAEKTTPAPNTSAQDAKIQDVTDRAKALVGSDKPDTEEEEKALESALRDAKIQDVADRAKALVGGDEASSSDQVAQAESDLADIEDQLAMDKMQDVADRAKAISVHQPDMEDEGELEKLEQEEAHAVEPIKKQMIQEEDKAGCIATKMKKIADVTDRAKALKIATMQSQLSNDQLSADEDELAKLECELDDDKKADEGLKQAQELPDPGLIEEKAVDQAEANNLEGAMKAAETLTDEQIKQEECDKLAAMSGFISGGDGLVSENMSPELKKRMQKLQSQLSSAVTTKEKMAILGAAAEQSAQQAKTQLESATEDGKDLKQKIHAANVLTDQANANVAKTDEDLKTSQNKMKVLGEKMKEKAADIRKSKVVQSMANQSAKLKAQAATKAHVQSKLDAAAAPSMISYLQSKASAVFMSLPGIHLPGTKPAEPAKEEKKAGTPPDPASQMEDAVDGMKSDAEAAKIVARKAAQKMSNAKKEADQLADVAEAAKKKLDVHSKVAKKAKAELKQSLEDANEATQDLGNSVTGVSCRKRQEGNS